MLLKIQSTLNSWEDGMYEIFFHLDGKKTVMKKSTEVLRWPHFQFPGEPSPISKYKNVHCKIRVV
jgi:hypothetical protein